MHFEATNGGYRGYPYTTLICWVCSKNIYTRSARVPYVFPTQNTPKCILSCPPLRICSPQDVPSLVDMATCPRCVTSLFENQFFHVLKTVENFLIQSSVTVSDSEPAQDCTRLVQHQEDRIDRIGQVAKTCPVHIGQEGSKHCSILQMFNAVRTCSPQDTPSLKDMATRPRCVTSLSLVENHF